MKPSKEDIIKANRKGRREAFLDGGKDKLLVTKIHKKKNKYNRKKKHQKED